MPDTSRVRLSIVGVVVAALFCSLLARLWFLQVRESQTNVQINNESVRTVHTDSPRGVILDRSGTVVLAGNRLVWTVIADPALRNAPDRSKLRAQMVPKLAALLGETNAQVTKALDDQRVGPLQSAVIAQDVSDHVRTLLAERALDYPHVALQAVNERSYPYAANFAPQVLGYTGLVNTADLKRHPDYLSNGTIGRSGIEQVYDSVLRGTPSTVDVNVNPAGVVVGAPLHTIPGKPGHDVQLTVDAGIQRSVQQSLEAGIVQARHEDDVDLVAAGFPGHTYRAPAGSAVVLDATNGDVVAMASFPTYDNSANIGAQYTDLSNPAKHFPLINRATSGLYAPGSTFKLITSQAAIETSDRGLYQTIDDTGVYTAQSRDKKKFRSAGAAGVVDLQHAITASSDVYFYGIGDDLYQRWAAGDKYAGYAIQRIAREFGFGSKTSIDLDESRGVVPDAEWRKSFVTHQAQLGVEPYKSNLAGYIGWNPADNINLAVGQGDLLVTPLQLADAYAAFVNGGTLWQPRLVNQFVDPANGAASPIAPRSLRHITVPDQLRQAMLAGFKGVVGDSKGTASPAFAGLDVAKYNVFGKTGTAQVGTPDKAHCMTNVNGVFDFKNCIGDTSWFVGMFGGSDSSHPRYVVVVNVEQGGFGGRIAAPVARQIIEKMSGLRKTPIPDIPAAGHR